MKEKKTSLDMFLRYDKSLRLIVLMFLLWGFITVIHNFLVQELIEGLHVGETKQDFLAYIFFGAYFLIGYPAAILVEKVGFKDAMKIGLYVGACAVFPMVSGARLQSYELIVAGTFVLAAGITILQVSANMYAIFIGDPKEGVSRILYMQAFNSFGTWLAPLLGTLIATAHPTGNLSVEQMDIFRTELVVLPYVLFTVIFLGMAIFVNFSDLPLMNNFRDVPTNVQNDNRTSVLGYKHVIMGALAICCYVGAEVSIGSNLGNYIVEELKLTQFSDLIGYIVPYYWGGAMVGRFVGANIAKKVKSSKMLVFAAAIAIALIGLSALTTKVPAMLCLLAIGMFNSIMFPVIFYLGTHGLGKWSARASGILNMGIVGGAIILLAFNKMVAPETVSMKAGMVVPVLCYLYIILYGIWGHRYKKVNEIGVQA